MNVHRCHTNCSCESCKRRKIKCDRVLPNCSQCNKEPDRCEYTPRLKPGHRAETPAHARDSINDLATRLEVLETVVLRYSQHSESDISERFTQPQLDSPHPSTTQYSNDFVAEDLPPKAVLEVLINLYFKHIHPWAPILHETSLRVNIFQESHLSLLYAIVLITLKFTGPDFLPNKSIVFFRETAQDHILRNVLDLGSLVSLQSLLLLACHECGFPPGPRSWGCIAVLVAAGVRYLRLDDEYPMRSNKYPDFLLNFSTTGAEIAEETASYIEQEERRRCFWMIYFLDRFSSASLGSAISLRMDNVHLRYPQTEESWNEVSNAAWYRVYKESRATDWFCMNDAYTSPWAKSLNALVVHDSVQEFLMLKLDISSAESCSHWQTTLRHVDANMRAWYDDFNAKYPCPFKGFDLGWVMALGVFYTSTIRLFAFPAYPAVTSAHFKASQLATERVEMGVNGITDLAKTCLFAGCSCLPPQFAFITWVAARAHIISKLSKVGSENTSNSVLTILLRVLRDMSATWECAAHYLSVIEEILNRNIGPQSLSVFTDSRTTAYGVNVKLRRIRHPGDVSSLNDLFELSQMPGMLPNSANSENTGNSEMFQANENELFVYGMDWMN